MSSPAENGLLATSRRTVWSSLDNLQRRAVVPNEWGGTLGGVAILAGIGAVLSSYSGLVVRWHGVGLVVVRRNEIYVRKILGAEWVEE